MKKLTVSEVSKVIGGTSCKVTFEKETVDGATVCRKVNTCTGKYGETVTRMPADLSSCN
ncbi:DUF4762 family protein [Chania multitudinisentens]|uniref:DUF4762 family protein n=1 Tax=Chania multitudinisentens TaxID=1639108 RepID=UPI00138B0199|nr:DUF4762 family protein [Chania multitudinisentens]